MNRTRRSFDNNRKAQQRKHAIYYLFLPKQKPVTWYCSWFSACARLTRSSNSFGSTSFSVLKTWRQVAITLRIDVMKDRTSGGFVSFWRFSLPSAGSEETAGLCSVPRSRQQWRLSEQNKSKTKTVFVSFSEEGTEISSSKMEKRFSKLHPHDSGCVKPGVSSQLISPLDCDVYWGSTTFKLGVTSLWSWRSFRTHSQ